MSSLWRKLGYSVGIILLLAVVAAIAYFFYDRSYSVPGIEAPMWVRKTILQRSLQMDYISKCVNNEKVDYYIRSKCCGEFNYIYDEEGNILCAPDGGTDGKGDRACLEPVNLKSCEKIWTNPLAALSGTDNGGSASSTGKTPSTSKSSASDTVSKILESLDVKNPKITSTSLKWNIGTSGDQIRSKTYSGYGYSFSSSTAETETPIAARVEQALRDDGFTFDPFNFTFTLADALNSSDGYTKADVLCAVKSFCQINETGKMDYCSVRLVCANKK